MAKQGLLPRKLAKYPACRYGKATRQPWRRKPTKDAPVAKLRKAQAPGGCVSVDRLESTTPGLIAQVKGLITTKRYRAATIFVDHHSALSYVHLQKSTNTEETLEAKVAFERYAAKSGVTIKHYHADNGRFGETAFKAEVLKQGQTISFCGVNAHFQNAVAERRIRILQDQARAMILHARGRWPSAIDAHLWPYAIRMANEVYNSTPTSGATRTPYEVFHGSKVSPNLKFFQPFGCPVFVLDKSMQAGKKIPKWNIRARMGIYLGMSMQHARSVALVLNMETGHISPQFHVTFDPKFETIRGSLGNISPESKWQVECGFKERSKKISIPTIAVGRPPTETPRMELSTADEDLFHQPTAVSLPGNDRTVDNTEEEALNTHLKRSKRVPKPSKYDREGIWVTMEAELEKTLPYYVVHEAIKEWFDPQDQEGQIIAYGASTDPDTMYYHEAMREPDREQFLKAMKQEVENHTQNQVW